jgi:hypothetical protein
MTLFHRTNNEQQHYHHDENQLNMVHKFYLQIRYLPGNFFLIFRIAGFNEEEKVKNLLPGFFIEGSESQP